MSAKIFDPSLKRIVENKPTLSLFPVRDDEPDYARLSDTTAQEKNRYGNAIALVNLDETASLRINGIDEIGENPHRNKQHAFFFNADNCIGCHACESACSEKNNLKPHLSFRSVGYVEAGTFPNYQRLNISMACNHCDDPVCLKGCPTRAYTKHPEYGAVIQDPDICFGCGYCTWVCPYNAPQLDTTAGQVEKCNMCVDRLEVGLKPACVSACVGNALDFGVAENKPANRLQIETRIPGFPDPSISKPNIRFQQIRSLPREVTRTDTAPVKYVKDPAGHYRPAVDQKTGTAKQWNLGRLNSRENPLVIFTLSTQAAVGIFLVLFLGQALSITSLQQVAQSVVLLPLLLTSLALTGLGLLMSTIHLGKPLRFYRGFNNLRHSPVSREGLGIVIFMACVGIYFLAVLPAQPWLVDFVPALLALQTPAKTVAPIFGVLAVIAGITALYYMYRCYCIKARPFWNHWHAAATFYGNMLALGALVVGIASVLLQVWLHTIDASLLRSLSWVMLAGLMLEAAGLYFHARAMRLADHEGAASHYIQTTTFGKTYWLRNSLLAINTLALLLLVLCATVLPALMLATAWLLLATSMAAVALIGRALFYVLVVPTTIPGAFFWKNKGFEQHARDIGLAAFPQVGVAPDHHH